MRPLLLALIVFSGCGITRDETIDVVHDPCGGLALHVSSEATAEERKSVIEAAEIWNAIAWLHLSLSESLAEDEGSVPIDFRAAPLAFLGVYEDESGEVLVNRRIKDARARAITVAHEVGHAMGLAHVTERASIMNIANTEVLPTADDEATLLGRWGCAP